MNATDLRIAFKLDTGDYALWAEDHFGKDMGGWGYRETTFQKGNPRSVYGCWLEEKIGKTKYLRDRYYKLHREMPTSSYFGFHGRYHEAFYKEYIEWLEAFVLKFKPEIVSNIIKMD